MNESNQNSFFENIDPKKKPQRPEQFLEDYDDSIDEDCSSCGNHIRVHTTRELVACALNELRGDIIN
ncbi:MAG: hypothetical protein KGZ34_03565 [Nitrosarchaeum sp.]|nr:hypothetical protein [Nitrosarchaeum sp.]